MSASETIYWSYPVVVTVGKRDHNANKEKEKEEKERKERKREKKKNKRLFQVLRPIFSSHPAETCQRR